MRVTFSRTCMANTGPSCAWTAFFRVFPCQMYTFPLAPPENTRSEPLPYVTHIIVSAFPALPNVPRLDVKPPPVCVQNLMCFIPAVTRRSGFCGFHFITNILSLWPLQWKWRQGEVYVKTVPHTAQAHPSFCSIKWLVVFLPPPLPPGWDVSLSLTCDQAGRNLPVTKKKLRDALSQVSLSQGYLCQLHHLYTGTVRVKCLVQECNAMTLARVWT